MYQCGNAWANIVGEQADIVFNQCFLISVVRSLLEFTGDEDLVYENPIQDRERSDNPIAKMRKYRTHRYAKVRSKPKRSTHKFAILKRDHPDDMPLKWANGCANKRANFEP